MELTILPEDYIVPNSFISKMRSLDIDVRMLAGRHSTATHVSDYFELFNASWILKIDSPAHIDDPVLQNLEDGRNRMFWTMTHLDLNEWLADWCVLNRHIRVTDLDLIKNLDGSRRIECFELTGQAGAKVAIARYRYRRSGCSVPMIGILGNGRIAKGAKDYLFAKDYTFLQFGKHDQLGLERQLSNLDILINGINWPMHLRGSSKLVTKEMLDTLEHRLHIVDLDVDYENLGPIYGCKPSFHSASTIWTSAKTNNNVPIEYACVWGWPMLLPEESGLRYFTQLADYIESDIEDIRRCYRTL